VDTSAHTILDLLVLRHEERGSATAILAPDREAISYAALRTGIERAGDRLAALGLGRGSRIAIALPDGLDTAVALLAATSWATCAPLNPRLDERASAALFDELRIDALIVEDGDERPVVAAARAAGLLVVRLAAAAGNGGDLLELRAESVWAPVQRIAPQPDDLALVIHTSGTTGRPRAVPVTHRALLWAPGRPWIDSSDRALGFAPLYTGSAIGGRLVVPLAAGASTVIVPGFDAARFFEWLDAFRPTYYSASPTVHAAIIDEILLRRRALPTSLRFVRSSSSSMSVSLQERLEAVLRVPVIQGYGMAEAGIVTQDFPDRGRRRIGSVGTSRGLEIMILGERGAALPAGADGEILVRGPGVMRGYENDQVANRVAFHEGWFRTGDIGHLDADGYLFITGRIKEIINRGGLKVAPAEVDAMFQRHAAVRDAATVGIPHPSLGEDVVTAVILREGESITAPQLRDYALRNLAPFKVPSSVIFVSEFPRSALGKVQRRVLADSLRQRTRPDFVAPRDAEERLIADVFASLLGLSSVGALDNFFDLGGDSLRATRALSQMSARLGVEVEPVALFEAPTVEQLAQRLRRTRGGPSTQLREAPPLVRRAHRPINAATASAVLSPKTGRGSSA